MNGYQLTRQWFEWRFNNPGKLSSAHAELYFYIVDRWNYFGQKSEFGLPRLHTMEVLSIGSRNTYKKLFGDLIEHGFIKLIRESCNQYHHASIIGLSKFEQAPETPLETPTETPTEQPTAQAPDPIVKPNNLGTKKPKKEVFDFSKYEELSQLVEKWIGYRKSINKPYKSQESLDSFVKHLRQLAGNDYQKAQAIIEQSIANQWQGIFELNNKSNAGSNNSQLPVDASQIVNYGKGNGKCFLDKKSGLWYEPLTNGYLPKEISDYYYYDQGNHSNYGDYVRWMIENNKTPLPPEDMRYFPADWNFEKFVSEQRAIVASSNF